MVGIPEISAGLGGLKAIKDIIQGLNAANLKASINDVKIDLQSHIIDVQTALFAAQEQQSAAAKVIADLEQEIVKLKNWEAEKQRYEFCAVGTVGFAYSPKSGMENGEPMHWLCQPCFDTGHKSVLQFTDVTATSGGRGMKSSWRCSKCGGVMKAGMSAKPSDPSTW